MLQQTPVARVLPVHEAVAGALADPGGAGRRADRRGGPRLGTARLPATRAAAARGRGRDRRAARRSRCPRSTPTSGRCPASATTPPRRSPRFAFGRRHVVLDTNVRRVLARVLRGVEFPAASVTRAERELAASVLPDEDATAATWSVAVMELGALVCTAARPALRRLPGRGPLRVAARPATRRTTARRGARRRGPAPTGSAAAGCSPCSGRRTARSTAAGSTPSGRTPRSARGASPDAGRGPAGRTGRPAAYALP